MLQLQLSQMTGFDYGYVGGYPDLDPVNIGIEFDGIVNRIIVPVSMHLPISVFKPWILNKFNFGSNDY